MGWNGSDGATSSAANQPRSRAVPSKLKGVVAGVIIVIVGFAACYFLLSSSSPTKPAEPTPAPSQIKEVQPAIPPKAPEIPTQEPATNKLDQIKQELNEEVKDFVKKATSTNNVTFLIKPLDPDDPDNALRTRVAQELGSLLSIEPGEPMPPFPYSFLIEEDQKNALADGKEVGAIDNGNKAFMDSLKRWKIIAKETDSDRQIDHKSALLEAQGELLDGIDNGISVNDSIRAAYEFRKRAYEMRSTIVQTLNELAVGETDHAHTLEQISEMNNRLAEEGIKKISVEEVIPDYEGPEIEEIQQPQSKEEVIP